MRLRRSPRAALGSVDSPPAKFESKILRPCEACLAGKRNRFSKVGARRDRRQQRGARGLIRWPSSGRRLLRRVRQQRVRPAAEAGRAAPGPRAQRLQEADPPPGRPRLHLQSPEKLVPDGPCHVIASLCPLLALNPMPFLLRQRSVGVGVFGG